MDKASSSLGVQPALGGALKCCCSCPMQQDQTLPFPVVVKPPAGLCCARWAKPALPRVPRFVPAPVPLTLSEATGFGEDLSCQDIVH